MARKRILNKSILFIEGESKVSNGDLRRGFRKLIEQAQLKANPRIIMGGNKPETIKKFLKNKLDATGLLLIDLDAPEEEIEATLKAESLDKQREVVFFMIQEMEAWFISQPQTLVEYYRDPSIADRITKQPPREVNDPKAELRRLTHKHPRKGSYHEVKDGTELLARLDLSKLRGDFPQVDRLVKALESVP